MIDFATPVYKSTRKIVGGKYEHDMLEITFSVPKDGNFRIPLLISSDEHYDSKQCRRDLLKEQWGYAKENGMFILSCGDFFDLMGGKYDPRTAKNDLRPEYVISDEDDHAYLNLVMKSGVEFLKDYKENLLLLVRGNHEENIRKRHEFSVVSHVVMMMKNLGALVVNGNYRGFIRLRFVTDSRPHSSFFSYIIYYTHGTGTNATVTKGVIHVNRVAEQASADCYISGHIHNEWSMSNSHLYVDQKGGVREKRRLFIQVGTYKKGSLKEEYSAKRGFGSPALGATILELEYKRRGQTRSLSANCKRMHRHDMH